jgi:hypothetical protein
MDTAMADEATQVGQGLEVTIPRSVPHAYNNSFTVRLSYADNYRMDVNYGSVGRQIFRMNSIYDPDYTNTGHQPMFRDMWASQYDYYAVLHCDYEIHLFNGGVDTLTYTAVGTAAQRLGCVQAHFVRSTNVSDFITTTSVYPIAEMKNVSTKFIVPETQAVFSGTLSQGDFLVDAVDSDSDQTWIAMGANPTINRFFGVVVTSAQPAAIVGQNKTPFTAIQAYVKLDYTVQFTQVSQALRSVPS